MSYIPKPPRVWSRVQSACTYTDPDLPDRYDVYVPLTGQTTSQGEADYETKMFYKGNILQYKGNSARLTKSQKYSQLARGAGPNRTKVFATQSQTYTNPNTTGLLRVGYTTYPYPNEIVGAPNNISGPFAYVNNPDNCPDNSVQDGGTLVCGTFANPCTGEIYKQAPKTTNIHAPSSGSNVPGTDILFWNNKIQTYFPRQNLTNNNSGNKWPVNYKELVSAVQPNSPYLTVEITGNDAILNWTIDNQLIPISQFNIYENSSLIKSVPPNTRTTTIKNLNYNTIYSFMVASLVNMNGKQELYYSNMVNIYINSNIYSITLTGVPVSNDNTKVTLNWSTSSYNGICSWQLYQNNILIGNYPTGTTSITLSGLIPGNIYTYYVKSLNCYNSVITQSNNLYVRPINIQVQRTTPGTYSLPLLTNYLYYNNVTVIGGGGGGGAGGVMGNDNESSCCGDVMGTENDSGCIGGSGGGGGGISIKNTAVYITTQTSLSYTIGSGGSGGNSTSGQNGNSSTFDDGLSLSITANGGSGGLYNGTILPEGNLMINNGGLGGTSSGADINGTGGNGGNSGSIGSPTGENIGFVNYATSGSVSTITNGSGGGGGGGCIFRTAGSGGVYFDSVGASGGNGGNGAIGGSAGHYGDGGSGTGTIGYGGSGGGGVGGNRFSDTTPTGSGGNGIYGSGGGGGGASHTSSNIGNGGNGGNGFVGFTVYTINIS